MHIHSMAISLSHLNSVVNHYIFLIFALGIWEIVWKGLALYKAARAGKKGWYVVLLLVNSVGILEILYFFVFSKRHKR